MYVFLYVVVLIRMYVSANACASVFFCVSCLPLCAVAAGAAACQCSVFHADKAGADEHALDAARNMTETIGVRLLAPSEVRDVAARVRARTQSCGRTCARFGTAGRRVVPPACGCGGAVDFASLGCTATKCTLSLRY